MLVLVKPSSVHHRETYTQTQQQQQSCQHYREYCVSQLWAARTVILIVLLFYSAAVFLIEENCSSL